MRDSECYGRESSEIINAIPLNRESEQYSFTSGATT